MGNSVNNALYKAIVKPTAVPTRPPMIQLLKTKVKASYTYNLIISF